MGHSERTTAAGAGAGAHFVQHEGVVLLAALAQQQQLLQEALHLQRVGLLAAAAARRRDVARELKPTRR
jgi:hypothetical protein